MTNQGTPDVQALSTSPIPTPIPTEPSSKRLTRQEQQALFAALLSLQVAILANSLVKAMPMVGLLLFAAAGFLMTQAQPAGFERMDGLPTGTQARQAWEPWFVVGLLVLGYVTRLRSIATYPATGIYSEGLLAARLSGLLNAPYTPYDSDWAINWPTLWHYQGILFGKLFGPSPGSYRAVSALWGVLSLPAFYVLCRRLTSPLAAAVGSLLLAGFYYHLHFSMRFNPLILCFFVPIFVMAAFLQALDKRRWYYFAATGFGLGLSLHGYFPLRLVPAVFALWLGILWLTQRDRFPTWRELRVLLVAFVVTAGPVLLFAMQHPDQYNAYINSTNELGGKGLGAYVQKMWEKLPDYLKLFHVQELGDSYEDTLIPHEILHPVVKVLFPIGLFYCLFQFWQPIPSLLLLLFAAGLVPGLLGGHFPFAAARRVLVSFTPVLLFSVMAVERLRLALNPRGWRWLQAALLVLGLGFGIWNVASETARYRAYNEDPLAQLRSLSHDQFLAGQAIAKAPGAAVECSTMFFFDDAHPFTMPVRDRLTTVGPLRNFFVLDPSRDHLLLLDGGLEGALPWFRDAFPDATIDVEKSKVHLTQDFIRQHTDMISDYYWVNPETYLVSVRVPKGDVLAFQSLVSRDGKVRAGLADDGFGSAQSGKRLRLAGSVIVEAKPMKLKFSLPWPGWTLTVNGRPHGLGQEVEVDGGVNAFEIAGTVPAGFKGALPLKVAGPGLDLVATHRVVAPLRCAMVAGYHKGERNWKSKEEFRQRLLFPTFRLNEDPGLGPYSLSFHSFLTLPTSARYQFAVRWLGAGAATIRVDGKVVNPQTGGVDVRQSAIPTPLPGGRPLAFEADWDFYGGAEKNCIFTLEYKAPGMDEFKPIPGEWFDAQGL